MPIHFICPYCSVATDVAEKYAGQTGPCAHCGKPITIPSLNGTQPPRRRGVFARVAVVVALLILAWGTFGNLWSLLPWGGGNRAVEYRVRCADNLRRIALAMQEYEAANGHFPPAYLPDEQGRPMHSWRVLLLPYLGMQHLYDRYRLDEPWDSSNNFAVAEMAIGLYQCPAQPDIGEPITNYMMVLGPQTISNGRQSRKITEISDGLANTIMLVEVADSGIRWAEPKDLHFDKLKFAVNGNKRQGISSYHPLGANAAFCDGSVHFLRDSTKPEVVKAMLTINGGESIPSP